MRFFFSFIILIFLTLPASLFAQNIENVKPISIGEQMMVSSKIMEENREVSVFLPLNYDEDPSRKFPVLYLIDGGLEQDFLHIAGTTFLNAIWGRSHSVIVVGIATKERSSELTGITQDKEALERWPNSGKSKIFRRFIADEVIPEIEKRYRTNGKRGVIGESLAGLFIVETALEEPEIFQRHAAISPSLWWDNEGLSKRAKNLLKGKKEAPKIYLSIGTEGAEMRSGYDRLIMALSEKEKIGDWCSLPRPNLTHATIYHSVSPQALQYLFPQDIIGEPVEGFEFPCLKLLKGSE